MDRDQVESCYAPAAIRALASFPVEAQDIELITHSENVTFRVSVRDTDTGYVLRLHRPGYNSLAELDSEKAWTAALTEAGIPVPHSLPTCDGQHYVLIDIPGTSEQRYAGMTTWREGVQLSDYMDTSCNKAERQSIYRRLGELAAAIHNQSTRWKEPSGFVRRHLGLDGLLGETPIWGRFWEHTELTGAERQLLLRTREKLRVALDAYGKRADNFSLIHADLHSENVVYNEGELALIDFDDSGYGWHLYDIAAALIESKMTSDSDAASIALLDGYREYRQLARQDVAMLPAFLLIRGMAIIGWFHQRPEHTGSEYFAKMKSWVLEECNASER